MRSFANDGLTFDVTDAGPEDAGADRTALLLHGFPQTQAAWSGVQERLAAQGIRSLAPALRGCCPGAAPTDHRRYTLAHIVSDTLALADEAGLERVNLVGHDWGGSIAWVFALTHPERVRSLTVLSTPHPRALQRSLLRSRQGLKSWYMLAMQVPALPEAVFEWGLRNRGLGQLGLPPEHERAYAARLATPGAWRTALAPYRALRVRQPRDLPRPRTDIVTAPTTYVWGRKDPYLGRHAAEHTAEYCTGDYRFVPLDADHWLPEKQTDLVAEEIMRRVTA